MPYESAAQRHQRTAWLVAVASRQWGAITHRRLVDLGFSKGEIRRMRERGFLIAIHRGVYIVGALTPAPEQRRAAAGNFGLLPPREVIEVAVPKRRRGDATLRVHERRHVEITQHHGIPTTRRGARGATRLAEAAGQPLVRSRLEARALRELGVPAVNERVGQDEVDLRWGDLVVALDHDQTHGTKWARERDARKDQRLRERGLTVKRFTV